jgi:hypothetical protein
MKIALIEDRLIRLKQFEAVDLMAHKAVKVITGIDFDNLMVEVEAGNMNSLDEFSCIASHRSALTNTIRDTIKKYCKVKKKPLVFFSGGITSSVFNDREFPFLHINSKDFYSSNLKLVLDDLTQSQSPNLLKFQFGDRWKVSMLLSIRNAIQVYLNKLEIKKQYPSVELDSSENITSIGRLQINAELMSDLKTEKSLDFLNQPDYSRITTGQLVELVSVIKKVIIKSL